MTLTRYHCFETGGYSAESEANPEGKWVLYEDAQAEIERVRAEVLELRQANIGLAMRDANEDLCGHEMWVQGKVYRCVKPICHEDHDCQPVTAVKSK